MCSPLPHHPLLRIDFQAHIQGGLWVSFESLPLQTLRFMKFRAPTVLKQSMASLRARSIVFWCYVSVQVPHMTDFHVFMTSTEGYKVYSQIWNSLLENPQQGPDFLPSLPVYASSNVNKWGHRYIFFDPSLLEPSVSFEHTYLYNDLCLHSTPNTSMAGYPWMMMLYGPDIRAYIVLYIYIIPKPWAVIT